MAVGTPAGWLAPAPGNAPTEDFLGGLLDPSSASYIGNKYKPAIDVANASVKQALAGYGGFSFTQNPDGTLKIDYNAKHAPGPLETQAVHDQYNQANARGMLYSSFADKAVGQALQGVSDRGRAIALQYGGQIAGINASWQSEMTNTWGDLTNLYGQDIQYAADNMPADYSTPTSGATNPVPAQNIAAFKAIDASIAPAPVAKELGPWASKPNLPVGQYSVYQRGGKWYAKRLT